MKSAIYTPYLDTFGGGERYLLTIAEYLNRHHEVDVFWDGEDLLQKQAERLNLDLKNCRIVPNIFDKGFSKRFSSLRQYAVLVYLSDGSFPLGLARKNILHLQVPFDLSNEKTIKNKVKLMTWQHVIVNSEFTKEHVDKTYGINSTVLYPPVAIEDFQPLKKEKNHFVRWAICRR